MNFDELVSCPVNANASIKTSDFEMHHVLLPMIWISQARLKAYFLNESVIVIVG